MVQGIMENKMSACMGIPFSEVHCDGFFHPLIPYGYPLDTHLLSWENHFFKKIVLIFPHNNTLGLGEF
jgi:hypothetical protein